MACWLASPPIRLNSGPGNGEAVGFWPSFASFLHLLQSDDNDRGYRHCDPLQLFPGYLKASQIWRPAPFAAGAFNLVTRGGWAPDKILEILWTWFISLLFSLNFWYAPSLSSRLYESLAPFGADIVNLCKAFWKGLNNIFLRRYLFQIKLWRPVPL